MDHKRSDEHSALLMKLHPGHMREREKKIERYREREREGNQEYNNEKPMKLTFMKMSFTHLVASFAEELHWRNRIAQILPNTFF